VPNGLRGSAGNNLSMVSGAQAEPGHPPCGSAAQRRPASTQYTHGQKLRLPQIVPTAQIAPMGRIGSSTYPRFTGLLWIYAIFCRSISSEAITWGWLPSCQENHILQGFPRSFSEHITSENPHNLVDLACRNRLAPLSNLSKANPVEFVDNPLDCVG